jgi:hypothetical protein
LFLRLGPFLLGGSGILKHAVKLCLNAGNFIKLVGFLYIGRQRYLLFGDLE